MSLFKDHPPDHLLLLFLDSVPDLAFSAFIHGSHGLHSLLIKFTSLFLAKLFVRRCEGILNHGSHDFRDFCLQIDILSDRWVFPFLFSHCVLDFNLHIQHGLELLMTVENGLDPLRLGDKIPSTFNHDDRGLVTGHNKVDITFFLFGKCGIDPELTAHPPHSDCGYGPHKRDVRNFKSGGRAQKGQNVPLVFLVGRQHTCYHLNLVKILVREKGP